MTPLKTLKYSLLILTSFFLFINKSDAQKSDSDIKEMIVSFKQDQRGPYKDIRWFCPDGSTQDAKSPCTEKGGFQRARYKDEVNNLHLKNNIYLGQILKGTSPEMFYDLEHDQSRAKQYVLQKYLYNNDEGWILQKAKYYRGAIQAEDEESWGNDFLLWLLDPVRFDYEKYYLNRELVKHIPHGVPTNTLEKIRALSKNIAEKMPSFMDLRTKIHSNPQENDVPNTEQFLIKNKSKINPSTEKEIQELIDLMNTYYQKSYASSFKKLSSQLDPESSLKVALEDLSIAIANKYNSASTIIRAADVLTIAKSKILSKRSAKSRLLHMEISLEAESFVLANISNWKARSVSDILDKTCYLGQVLNETGFTYDWEYHELLNTYGLIQEESMTFEDLLSFYKTARRHINWGSGLIDTEFGNDVRRYETFEPLSNGFIDDRIRSSALLPLGEQAALIYDYLANEANWQNKIFDKFSSSIQGINPGYAKGKLIIVNELGPKVDPKAIYLFRNPPSDLEPVAGILSISEGNLVSHLQLLARNLGIPNANISEDFFNDFKKYDGQEIFYAVSNRGGVKISLASKMTTEEMDLFKTKTIDDEVVTVPIDQMQLSNLSIYTLKDLNAQSSGIICGPKAANFAQLKNIFPNHLVDGLVVSFAIFKDHMLQQVPNQPFTYWEYLTETFDNVALKKNSNVPTDQVEEYTLERLANLSTFIKTMPIKNSFLSNLDESFKSTFGSSMGNTPVFLRSDTNMEDLKDFTGAGLNLTVFNTIEKEKIIQGIRDVWASPYSDRSYKWRQKYLTNPQDVYPSILIIPSVFVDYSGVVITKDFADGSENKINAAISQGVGGAVDGQKSESWILAPDGNDLLISPARDPNYKLLSRTGGVEKKKSRLNTQMLTQKNKQELWQIINKIQREMPSHGMLAPYDIELGFENDTLWLFQIRPFVENKKASSSIYLSKLDPSIPYQKIINLKDEVYQ